MFPVTVQSVSVSVPLLDTPAALVHTERKTAFGDGTSPERDAVAPVTTESYWLLLFPLTVTPAAGPVIIVSPVMLRECE